MKIATLPLPIFIFITHHDQNMGNFKRAYAIFLDIIVLHVNNNCLPIAYLTYFEGLEPQSK